MKKAWILLVIFFLPIFSACQNKAKFSKPEPLAIGSQTDDANSTALLQIRSLYPNLSDQDFQLKVDGVKDSFHFLRTFVIYYWWLASKNPPATLGRLPVAAEQGWCAGDAHPENFGAIVNDDGTAQFAINDIDDSGPCPLYLDTLRFLTAINLWQAGAADVPTLMQAYIQALRSGTYTLSKASQDLVNKAQGNARPSDKDFNGTQLTRDSSTQDVSDDDLTELGTALSSAFPALNVQLLDALSLQKDSGGSGGMRRFRVLVDASGVEIIEFKENETAGITPVATGAVPVDADRLMKTLQLELGPTGVSQFYSVQTVEQMSMLLRPRYKGDKGVSMMDYADNDLKTLFIDEISTLALLHRKSAQNIENYIAKLSSLSPKAWSDAATDMTTRFQQAYAQIYH